MILFEASETKFLNNGLGHIQPMRCIETKCKSFDGWYIETDIPSSYAETIKKDMILFVETKEKGGQPFRIKELTKTDRKLQIIAHHVAYDTDSYVLADVRPENLSPVSFLDWINKRCHPVSPFSTSSNVSGSATRYFIRKTLKEGLCEAERIFGGAFDFDKFSISLLDHVGDDDGFSVVYGKNLQGVTVVEDWSSVVTEIMPVGPNGITLPEKYISSGIHYDVPYTRVIEFNFDTSYTDDDGASQTYTTEQQTLMLRQMATDYVEEHSKPLINYTIKSDVNQSLRIGDLISVKHPYVSIKTEVLSYTYDTIKKRVLTLEFGNYKTNAKNILSSMKDNIDKAIKESRESILLSKKQTELINNLNKNGLVYIDENEILILDALPKEKASNVWRFGMGGIGFSDNGYEGPFRYAFTQDGSFNIDFIKANSITVNKLAADVGSSLDLSSNKSIKLFVEHVEESIENIELNTIQLNLLKDGTVLNQDTHSITLQAQLLSKGISITNDIPNISFTWQRKSKDIVDDVKWNEAHKHVRSVTITQEDVFQNASFQVTVETAAYTKVSGYETITDETDIPKLSLDLFSSCPEIQHITADGLISPEWNPLEITPSIMDGVLSVTPDECEIVWKRSDGALQDGEEIVNGALKVSKNKLTEVDNKIITYICSVRYKNYQAIAQKSYALLVNGTDGQNGKDGKGIKNTVISFQASSSGTTTPSGTWTSTIPTVAENQYLWTRTVITYTDNSSTTSYSIGKMGAQGQKGDKGDSGVGIKSVTNYYLASASGSGVTASIAGWTTAVQTISESKKYLWNYEVVTYTNNTTTSTPPCIIGTYGEKGQAGSAGVGISTITEYYAVSTSNTTAPSSWVTTVPAMSATNKYLWNYEKITYTNSSTKETAKRVIGVYGDKGATGATGNGVSSIVAEYYLSTSKTTQAGGSWVTTAPTWSTGKYMWTRSKITYTSGTVNYTTPVCDSSWEAVNEIQVGGRNLIKNSSITSSCLSNWTVNATGGATVVIEDGFTCIKISSTNESGINGLPNAISDNVLTPNHKYTYSFWCKSNIARNISLNSILHFQTRAGSVVHNKKNEQIYPTSIQANVWTKLTCTFEVTTQCYFVPYVWYITGLTIFVRGFKLEEGNKATDWTPAPEDVDIKIGEDIANVEATITKNFNSTFKADLDEITSTVESITTSVTDAKTEIATLKNLFAQTDTGFSFTKEMYDEITNNLTGEMETSAEYSEWFQIDGSKLTLGKSNSSNKMTLTEDRLSFWQNDVEVAWVSNNELHIANVVVVNALRIGNWIINDEGTGGLTWRKLNG